MVVVRSRALAALSGVALLAGLAVTVPALAPVMADRPGGGSLLPDTTDAPLEDAYGKLPLRFEANHGQTDPDVAFTARGSGYDLFLTREEAVLTLEPVARATGSRSSVVRMQFAGGDPDVRVEGAGQQPGVTNYLLGSDPAKWRTDVPGFDRVSYDQLYPGIDLDFYGRGGHVEYDYTVAPGADPGAIRLAFPGADDVAVAGNGDLLVTVAGREVRQPRPVLYQGSGKGRRAVDGAFVVRRNGEAGFRVGAYDRTRPLVIDPVLTYSSFLGGSSADAATGVRVDSSGNAYLTGTTQSTNFPTQGPAYASAGGIDGFVTKLNPAGTALVYSTYLGGGGADSPTGIAVDGTGNAYITGSTASTNFPIFPAGAGLQAVKGPGTDAFVAKLSPTGNALTYSTYLGAGNTTGDLDVGRGIVVDSAGNATVAGETRSNNFATTANAFQGTFSGGTCPTAASGVGATTPCRDVFVTTLNAAGTALTYSSYLGGINDDVGLAVAIDGSDKVYVTGEARSTDFDVVAGAFQASHAGGTCAATFEANRPCRDAFVSKLDPAASGAASLVYSTYLGGNTTSFLGESMDGGFGIAADSSGNAYVTGQTTTDDFPTASPLQATRAGEGDAFVSKLNPSGSALVYSTYLGGPSSDNANGIAVDASGAAHLVGTSSSAGFPVVGPVAAYGGNSDAFATKLNAAGSALERSTYLGGHWSESGAAVAADGSGSTYPVGNTASGGQTSTTGNFPTVGGPQATFGGPLNPAFGAGDGFVSKIAAAANALGPLVTGLRSTTGPSTGGTEVVITGTNFTSATAVSFGATAAPSFVVDSPTQITAVSPAKGTDGSPVVTVTTAQGTSPANPVARFHYGEGTWTRTGSQSAARHAHTDTVLADGRVLSVGGRASSGGPAIASAEVYDPATGTWTPTGSLATARFVHTATLLPGGKVLVTGGFGTGLTSNAQHVLNDAEVWDPATGAWSVLPVTLSVPRALHMAALLPNGKVLIGGGRTCTGPPPASCDFTFVTATNELYDPATQTFAATGSFAFGNRHTTDFVVLDSGKVLVAGGFPGNGTNTAELYDPASGTWALTGNMLDARARPSMTKMANGKVLVTSGFPNAIAHKAEVYNPASGTWSAAGTLTTGRFNAASVLLPNGKVLLTGGGEGGRTSELYDPATNSFTSEGVMTAPHGSGSSNATNQRALLLTRNCGANCGKVLVVGSNGEPVADLYTPKGAEGLFHPVTPARILDTRSAAETGGISPIGSCTPSPCSKLGAGSTPNTIEVQVLGRGGVPVQGVSAVKLNVTATSPANGAQFLKVYPSDAQTEPNASNLNYVAGQTVPNLVTVKVGQNGRVKITNNAGEVNVLADVAGWYTDNSGLVGARYSSLTPARILDTRTADETGGVAPIGTCTPSCSKLGAGTNPNTIEVQVGGQGGVPAGATAVIMNVTATGTADGAQFLKVYPSDAPEPNASNLNYVNGQTVPNLVAVKLGPTGTVKITNNAGEVNVLADVAGWFSSDTNLVGGRFRALTPARILDTRTADETGGVAPIGTCTPSCSKLGAGTNPNTIEVQVGGQGGVPAGATAVIMNVTATGTADGAQFLKVYPSDAPEPNASNLNYVNGQTVPNLVAVKLGPTGTVKITNNAGEVNVLADVAGWFSSD